MLNATERLQIKFKKYPYRMSTVPWGSTELRLKNTAQTSRPKLLIIFLYINALVFSSFLFQERVNKLAPKPPNEEDLTHLYENSMRVY